jgi:uncharacterized membrane protein
MAMGSLMASDKSTARRKGLIAAAVTGGSVLAIVGSLPVLGIIGLAGAGYLTYDWFMFRAKRGMRF